LWADSRQTTQSQELLKIADRTFIEINRGIGDYVHAAGVSGSVARGDANRDSYLHIELILYAHPGSIKSVDRYLDHVCEEMKIPPFMGIIPYSAIGSFMKFIREGDPELLEDGEVLEKAIGGIANCHYYELLDIITHTTATPGTVRHSPIWDGLKEDLIKNISLAEEPMKRVLKEHLIKEVGISFRNSKRVSGFTEDQYIRELLRIYFKE